MARLTEAQVIAGLVRRGVPRHVAQGVAMNFQDESGFDSGITGPGGDFGLAQWTGPRRAALERYASAHGKPVDDPDLQLDFFMVENAGQEAEAWKKVLATSNSKDAAITFVNEWERPAAEYAQRRSAKYASMTPRVSGPVEAAGGGAGSDVGAPQLYTQPVASAGGGSAPAIVINQTPSPDFTPDSNPWTGLGSMLASSVDPNKPQFLSADPDEALPAIPEFDSALPTPQQMPPTPLLDALAPGTPPLGEVFKVADIGKAAVPKLDEFGRRVRPRQYG